MIQSCLFFPHYSVISIPLLLLLDKLSVILGLSLPFFLPVLLLQITSKYTNSVLFSQCPNFSSCSFLIKKLRQVLNNLILIYISHAYLQNRRPYTINVTCNLY